MVWNKERFESIDNWMQKRVNEMNANVYWILIFVSQSSLHSYHLMNTLKKTAAQEPNTITIMSNPLLLAVISMVSYINSFDCEFVFDDISAIVNNRYIRTNETTFLSLFSTDYWGTDIASEHSHKSYRPLTVITFRLNYLIHRLEPFGYHVVNVLLHLAVVQLYHRFSLKLVQNKRTALIASILFAIHPLKTEAVIIIQLIQTSLEFNTIYLTFRWREWWVAQSFCAHYSSSSL